VDVSEYGEITSVVVSRGGEVVVEEYFDGDAGTLRNTRSCTKTVAGMLLGAVGMLYLTGLGTHSSYAGGALPALMIMGVGFGMIFAPAISTATLGVGAEDAGVASATVNAGQQVGGSIGVALLSTLAASSVSSYIGGARPTPDLVAAATSSEFASEWNRDGLKTQLLAMVPTLTASDLAVIDEARDPAALEDALVELVEGAVTAATGQ